MPVTGDPTLPLAGEQLAGGLVVDGLVAGYRGRAVVSLPHLAVSGGNAVVVGGASGAGKTTVLLAIAGLAERIAGTIRLDGQDLGALPPRRRDRRRGQAIGIIFQDLHLVAGLSAVDNMLLAPFASGMQVERGRAVELLDRLGIGDRADARAETLSRGQAQRVAIARAMLMRPRLILADEPTASLDDDAAAAVLDLLSAAMRDSGAALVVATHDPRVRTRFGHGVMAEPAAALSAASMETVA